MNAKASTAQARRERNRRGVELFYTYRIELTRDGETWVREFKATNPGSAFAQCLLEFPGRIVLEGWRTARLITKGREIYRLVVAPASMVSNRSVTKPESSSQEISHDGKQDHDAASLVPQSNPPPTAAGIAGEKSVPRHYAKRRHRITGTFPAVLPHN